jgi:hypothetical protein
MNNMKFKDMPAIPDLFYRTEWKGWDDFLGNTTPYGWEIVEILKFNYNGMGDAIANCDGRTTYMHMIDLNTILFGNQYGSRQYKTIVNSGRFIMRKIHNEESTPKKGKKKIVRKKTKKSD